MVVTLAVGAIGVFAAPIAFTQDRSGDHIESYTATLHPDGRLDEVFVYTLVSSDTRMLFRYWDERLSFSRLYSPQIIPISVAPPPGSIAYVKDYKASVTIMSGWAGSYDVSTIGGLAYLNEAGCYKADYFAPGSYTISYSFRIVMELESDSEYDHLNLMLARDHLPYRNVRIVIADAGYVSTVYAHPPSLTVSHEGSDIVITGSSAENELLEFELLMPSGANSFDAYRIMESNEKSLTEEANIAYSRQYWTAYWLGYSAKAVVLLTPFLLLGLWLIYGREEDVTVPTYLSTVPNPERKPWLVNLVFRKGASDLDEDAFYATLLDLQRRRKIRIETREGGMKIFILDRNVDDAYEKRTMEFLGKFATLDATSPDNPQAVFDTDSLKELAGKISSGLTDSRASEAQRDLQALTDYRAQPWQKIAPIGFIGIFVVYWIFISFITSDPSFIVPIVFFLIIFLFIFVFEGQKRSDGVGGPSSREWVKESEAFFVKGRRRVWPIAAIGVILMIASAIPYGSPITPSLMWTPALLGLVVLGQAAIAYSFPETLFGRWRKGMYGEKKEWDAFRAHLGDLSQMRRYSPEDLSMWGTWLVYGTALGVGDRVAEAMKALDVKFDAATVPTLAHTHFHPMIIASPPASSGGGGHGGGRGGGGHGGGGGRGGGGGGRR